MILKQTAKFYVLLMLAVGCLSVFGQPASPPPASAASPIAATASTNVPLQTIASLIRDRSSGGSPSNQIVHVRGAVLDQRIGEYIGIRDDTGTILAVSTQALTVKMQTVVDVWGAVSGNVNHLTLQTGSTFRVADRQRPRRSTPTASPHKSPPSRISVLTNVTPDPRIVL